jgi:hypothetical protein
VKDIARTVALRFIQAKKPDTTEFLMGPGWKVIKDDGREIWYANQSLGYVIQNRLQSWAQHRPVIVKWEGGSEDGFNSVPAAIQWIKSHPIQR